ncbi:MAG: hypothetical protein JSS81_09720 [Acidobacteria bacterium]|nr:hypothetical protein [Acidobacteriota bacterium]
MKAAETAKKIIEEFGTRDPVFIAGKSGVKIVYESWHPVTAGEFDKEKKTIYVNLRAVETGAFGEQTIVAHELGHFFARELRLDRPAEEAFAAEFAAALLG